MSKLDEIRQDADKMENLIKAMIQDFIDKHGNCDIKLSSQLIYNQYSEAKRLTGIKVKVNIEI